MNEYFLDLVLPCYNPPEGWEDNIIQQVRALKLALPGLRLQVIIVNDGSSNPGVEEDASSIQRELGEVIYIAHHENQGKGQALRTGVALSNSPICIYTDIDFPYTLDSLVEIYRKLASGETDIAVGIKNKAYYKSVPPLRRLISRALRAMSGLFLGLSITDTQCGLKGFNQRGKTLFLQTTIMRYLGDLEFILLADRDPSVRMKAVPIELRPGIVFRSVNMNILWAEGLNFLKIWLKKWEI